MKKTITQKLAEAEARLAAKDKPTKTQETVPEAPEKVMQRLMEPAEETHLVRSETTGRFIKPRSDEARLQRRERAERAIEQIAEILESKSYDANDDDTVSVRILKSLVRGIIESSDEKGGLGAKAKAWDVLLKALGAYNVDKEEAGRNQNIVVIIPGPPEGAKIEAAPNNKPLIRPSWAAPPTIDAEVVSEN
jgi:hypothetical protein